MKFGRPSVKSDPRPYQSHPGMLDGMSDSESKLLRLAMPADLSGKRVLDIGCNEGYFCAVAAKRGATKVTGLDVETKALDFARTHYADLNIEFIRSGWDKLPDGPFDLVLWTSAMHYERDPGPVLHRISEILSPTGVLILECGVAAGFNREMVLIQRHGDSRWYPTLPLLQEVLLRDFSVRRVTHGDLTEGDPVPRSVFHCRRLMPTVLLVHGVPDAGKSWLAGLMRESATKIVQLDYFVSRMARAEFHHTDLQRLVRDAYNAKALGSIYSAIDEKGLTDDFARTLAESVGTSDRFVVIEGHLSDRQTDALRRTLAGRAYVWQAERMSSVSMSDASALPGPMGATDRSLPQGLKESGPTFLEGSRDFMFEGFRFQVSPDNTVRTSEEGVVLLKPWTMVRDEMDAMGDHRIRSMLEVGVYQGGSAILWSLLLPIEKYVGVDIRPIHEEIDVPEAVRNHPRWQAVRLYGETSQDDRAAIGAIMNDEFSGGLDLVIDDASHQYMLSRATFETCFPRLRPGGMYIIEDWSWAHAGPHSAPDHPWAVRPSLSNLVLRLALLAGARPDVIPEIVVRQSFVLLRRGEAKLGAAFDIEHESRNPRPLSELI
jgi:SAM-dependent methyltransferase